MSNLCCKAIFNLPLTIRQECYFDFIYINDLGPIVKWILENNPKYHDYNVCSGKEYLLSQYANKIKQISGKDLKIKILHPEKNLDYTASNQRLISELGDGYITEIDFALRDLYAYYESHLELIDYQALKESR